MNYQDRQSSVMADYDWPRHPSIPHPYESQKRAAEFMVLHPRCFNLSDMGTGKTLTALWAADFLMREYKRRGYNGEFRALIVAPLSILQRVWGDAIFNNFIGKRTFEILHGSQVQRLEKLARPADFYIVNFDGVGTGAHTRQRFELDGFSLELQRRSDVRLVIIDEATAYKDSRTKRHRLARLVLQQIPYLWCMSGTPTPNAPTDAYGLAKLVHNAHGKSFGTFQLETMHKVSQFKWVPNRDGYDRARRLLQPAIRIDIKDVWDGPPLTTQQREVPLTDEQKRHMVALKRDLVVELGSGKIITAAHEAAARQKFIQISLGQIYDAKHEAHGIDAKPRLDELKAVLSEASGKILVFVPLTSVVHWLYKELHREWECEIVYGDTPAAERSRIFSAFQSRESPRVLIADPRAVGHGLDLFAATCCVWYGPIDSSEIYAQANKRAHRPGQKYPVTIVQLVSNKLEREIFKRLENQQTMQGVLLDAVRRNEI